MSFLILGVSLLLLLYCIARDHQNTRKYIDYIESRSRVATESSCASEQSLSDVVSRFNLLLEKASIYEKRPEKFVDEFMVLMRSDENIDSRTFLFDLVNERYHGAMRDIRSHYKLTQYEVDLFCMISLGFSNSAMRMIFGHTNSKTIYNYRSSLKSKPLLEHIYSIAKALKR